MANLGYPLQPGMAPVRIVESEPVAVESEPIDDLTEEPVTDDQVAEVKKPRGRPRKVQEPTE